MGSKAIAEKIARFSREDIRERVLAQEILLSLDGLVKLEPELLGGFLTLRLGYLILLLTAEVSAEFSIVHNEAYQRLLEFSPSEIQSRLIKLLRAYAETTKLLRNQEALHLNPGVQIVWHPQLTSAGAGAASSPPNGGWLEYRRRGGALGQVPEGFYPEVWQILHHCRGLVIGDKLERRNRIDSAPILAEMTPGETNFARSVEHLLAKIEAPEYRSLTIEALAGLADFFRENSEFVLDEYLTLDVLIGHAVRLAWLENHKEEEYEDQKASAWKRFYEEPPDSVARWIIEALRYLVGQKNAVEPSMALPVQA
jgi:phosphorylase kinase alpha/beta subunit